MRRAGLFVVTLPMLGLLSLAACPRVVPCESVDGCVADETGTGDGDGDGDGTGDGDGDSWLTANKDVDILFVIDNSGSMGEEQALLVNSIGSFIDVLEAEDVDANYRIGITTTDNGNPWCPAGTTTPEGGKLVLSSCKDRLGDFLFADLVDVRDLACNDICTLSAAELEILPTTTDVDANPVPRPWLERNEGKKNIPEGTSTAAAFACFAPQGVNGCGFESQLESMYLALVRSQTNSEASYGFMRQSAILAVVILTDEADCSYNKEYAEIFEADGNKVFWADPTAAFPTSAVCWNAGVECTGDPSNYSECVAVNKGVNGQSGVADGDAVLHPMSRYIGLLQGLENEKQQINADQEVIVSLIAGVDSSGLPIYADVGDTDPVFQESFGIGPGCTGANPFDPNSPVQAVPPVRLRELSEAFTPDNMHSICSGDYSPALEAIANRIRVQIAPACYSKCVADSVPETALVEPDCTVIEDPPGLDNDVVIGECLRDANGYVFDPESSNYAMPSADANVCYAMLVDTAGLTPDPLDDMTADCAEQNYNLEFKIVRRPGFPAPSGTKVSATCGLADSPEVSCPGIGG